MQERRWDTHLAMAFAEVVQIECDGKLPGDALLFWPGMLCDVAQR